MPPLRFTVYMAVSLDGFIADREGGVGWLDNFSAQDFGYEEFFAGISVIVMGGRTYEQVLGFGEWPYGQKKCVVLTSRKLAVPPGANVEYHPGPVEDLLVKLAADQGGDVWLAGGAVSIASFLGAGIRPRLELHVIPVLLGEGVRLFDCPDWKGKVRLVSSQSYANGTLGLIYEPVE